MATAPNEAKLQEFLGKVVGDVGAAMTAALVMGGVALVAVLGMNASGTDAIRRSASAAAPAAHDSARGIPEGEPKPCAPPEPAAQKRQEPAFIGVCLR